MSTYKGLEEAHNGVVILYGFCLLAVLLLGLQRLWIPRDRVTRSVNFASSPLTVNYVLGTKQSFHRCSPLDADSQSLPLIPHPSLPHPLIPAIALLPTALQDNRQFMRVLLASLPPPANTFIAHGRRDIVWGQRVTN